MTSSVIEKKRGENDKDGLMWFSETANHLLYEEYFHLTNIEKDFRWYPKWYYITFMKKYGIDLIMDLTLGI